MKHKIKIILTLLCIGAILISDQMIDAETKQDSAAKKEESANVSVYRKDKSASNIVPEVNVFEDSRILHNSVDQETGIENYVTVNNTNEINIYLPGYVSKVTEVYSINNEIKNCFFRPKLEELAGLQEFVEKKCGLAKAYTGFFDLNGGDEHKPSGTQSRALEVLGYDFLLSEESYQNQVYTPVMSAVKPTKATILMNIYKALGMSKYDFYVEVKEGEITLAESPASLELPGLVEELDKKVALTNIFATRTVPERYLEMAEKDLKISKTNGIDRTMTNGEFIVLLTQMMKFYGEPAMSDLEMNMLLQAYGSTMPTYLKPVEQEAYLYLKARGILNIELDYMNEIELDDMFEILMCVQDENSRTNYKQVEVSLDLGDDLINKGYFPRPVTISTDEAAIEVSVTYDYTVSKFYDYYIKVNEFNKFAKNITGKKVDYLFVPSIADNPNSSALSGVTYFGIENGYYHLRIPIFPINSDYMKNTNGKIYIGSMNAKNVKSFIAIDQGGGIYSDIEKIAEDITGMSRRSFKENEYIGSSDIERVSGLKKVASSNLIQRNILQVGEAIGNLVAPNQIIKANSNTSDALYDYYVNHNTAEGIFIIKNAENIVSYKKDGYSGTFKVEEIEEKDANGKKSKSLKVTMADAFKDIFLASIKRDNTIKVNKSNTFAAVATITGETLISFNELEKAGLLYKNESGEIPIPDKKNDQLLVLNTANGQIKLNNATREVVVGSTLYKVKDDKTVLFKYVTEKGKEVLYIDFRAAYGWTGNIAEITYTGSGNAYQIQMKTLGKSEQTNNINLRSITQFSSFKTIDRSEDLSVLLKGINSTKYPQLLLTSNYSLSNYILFQGINHSTGQSEDYVFVFYRKEVFSKNDMPDGLKELGKVLGYEIKVKGWVCRAFKLNRSTKEKEGAFTYTGDYGYVYNLPSYDDFSISKYLDGTYALPICTNKEENGMLDANVNYFAGYPFGSRPTNDGLIAIDIKGKERKLSKRIAEIEVMAAPFGLNMFLGGDVTLTKETTSKTIDAKVNSTGSLNYYYFGTTPLEIKMDAKGVPEFNIIFASPNKYTYEKKIDLTKDSLFYLTKRAVTIFGKSQATKYFWNMTNDVILVNKTEAEGELNTIDIVDGENKEKYNGFDKFSLEYLLNVIDYSASWVIYFTFKIFPLLGIIAVTILLGISTVSEEKLVRLFCDKVFDPVRILTFGKMNIYELYFKKALWALLLGYLGFALILDCNLLRIIQWLLEMWGTIAELIKQM